MPPLTPPRSKTRAATLGEGGVAGSDPLPARKVLSSKVRQPVKRPTVHKALRPGAYQSEGGAGDAGDGRACSPPEYWFTHFLL